MITTLTSILLHPHPLLFLAIALALATATCSFSISPSKQWITMTCAMLFLICAGLLFYFPIALFWDTANNMGMGRPELLAIATSRLLNAALITPLAAIPTLIGLSISLSKSIKIRALISTACILLFAGADVTVVRIYDIHFSTAMVGGEWAQERRLHEVYQNSYIKTLEQAAYPANEIQQIRHEISPPRQLFDQIDHEDFLKEFRPASMISAILLGKLNQAFDQNRITLEQAVDKYRDIFVAEGKKQADAFLQQHGAPSSTAP